MTGKHYVYIGVVAATAFVLAFALGSGLNALTGVPLTGGIVNGIVVGVVMTVGAKGVNRFGSLFLIWMLFSVFALPTNTMGAPGLQKLFIGAAAGLTWDVVCSLLRRSNAGILLGGMISTVVVTFGTFWAYAWLGLPAAERLERYLPYVAAFNALIGGVAVVLGILLFERRLKKLRFMRGLLQQ